MTIAEFKKKQREIDEIIANPPLAWVLVSNPVYGRAEDYSYIALFDTKELLEAYYQASLLPEPKSCGRYHRSFRSDSLLYDFNKDTMGRGDDKHAVRAQLLSITKNLPENPTPPSGPIPEMKPTSNPQYGVDYGVGPVFR